MSTNEGKKRNSKITKKWVKTHRPQSSSTTASAFKRRTNVKETRIPSPVPTLYDSIEPESPSSTGSSCVIPTQTSEHAAEPGGGSPMWVNFPISPELEVVLKIKFPDFNIIPNPHGRPHTHPLSAIERRVSEELLIRKADAMGCERIIDIGGNPKRHGAAGRNIHSCCPELSPKDVSRNFSNTNQSRVASWCRHTAQECNCLDKNVDLYISVHSLYYLSPETVCMLLQRTNKKCVLAVVHDFVHLSGSFHSYGKTTESVYQSITDKIQMKVNGNQYVYQHANPRWLKRGYYTCKYGSMAWDTHVVGDSKIVTFVQAKDGLEGERSTMSLCAKINDTTHDDDEPESLAFDEYQLPRFSFKSVGFYCWLKGTKGEPVMVPKRIVATTALHISGRKREPATLQEAINRARKLLREEQHMSEIEKARCVTLVGCLAFVLTLQNDIDALVSQVQSNRSKIGLVNRFLNWDWMPICGRRTGNWYGGRRIGFCCWAGEDSFIDPEDPKTYYNTSNGLSTARNLIGLVYNMDPWQGVHVNRTLMPIREQAVVQANNDAMEEKCSPKMYQLAPHLGTSVPVVPESTKEHEIIGLHNRACMVVAQPIKGSWYDAASYWEHTVLKYHLEHLRQDIEPLSFNEWNSTFPRGRQKQQVLAREKLEVEGLLPKDGLKSTFIKVEKYNKSGHVLEDFDPRIIQGGQHKANVALSPWMANFNKFFKAAWSSSNYLTYASGMTSEGIGAWLSHSLKHMTDVIFLEIDFSRFDGTISEDALEQEFNIYKKYGLKRTTDYGWDALQMQYKKVGYTRYGTFYKVKGTRGSGEPNTSCGNTMLSGLSLNSALRKFGLSHEEFRAILLGDDSFGVLSLKAVERLGGISLLETTITRTMIELGLKPKVKISKDLYSMEFCSGIFWPVMGEQEFVLGCKPGKLLPKIAFSVKPLRKQDVIGMFIGYKINHSHVPIVRVYVDLVLKKLGYKGPIEAKRARIDKYKINAIEQHEYNPLSNAFTHRYGMEITALEKQVTTLLTSCSINAHLSFPQLDQMFLMDN